jgi:hypothetical protein
MKKVFDSTLPFEASRDAEEWCNERGISVGQMEREKPRALFREDCHVGKWSSLSGPERRQMDGTMTGDMRHGPVASEMNGEESDYQVIPEKYR